MRMLEKRSRDAERHVGDVEVILGQSEETRTEASALLEQGEMEMGSRDEEAGREMLALRDQLTVLETNVSTLNIVVSWQSQYY